MKKFKGEIVIKNLFKRKGFIIWGIGVLLLIGVGLAFYYSQITKPVPQPKSQITMEELNKKTDDLIKEFNKYVYDQHGGTTWYGTLEKTEVTLTENGEVLVKLIGKPNVKTEKETEVLDVGLKFFNEAILTKYKITSVKVQVFTADNKLLGEKGLPKN